VRSYSLVICHSDFLRHPAFCHSSFLLRGFESEFCYCWIDFQIAKVRRKKYASPHLVYLRRLPRGMCGQGAHAYASIDHVDSRARYYRLNYRRRGHSSVLSAWRRRQISSRRSHCFNRWGDFGFVHLAQVQAAIAAGVESARS
jgi:hypothetical protein